MGPLVVSAWKLGATVPRRILRTGQWHGLRVFTIQGQRAMFPFPTQQEPRNAGQLFRQVG